MANSDAAVSSGGRAPGNRPPDLPPLHQVAADRSKASGPGSAFTPEGGPGASWVRSLVGRGSAVAPRGHVDRLTWLQKRRHDARQQIEAPPLEDVSHVVLDVVAATHLGEDQAGTVGGSPSLQTPAWGVTPPRVTWVSGRHSGDQARAVIHSLSAFQEERFRSCLLEQEVSTTCRCPGPP